ncbi:MAG TPA: hypothetical protein VG496_10730, partial [Myxococcales bacterium]|nr:hypothetical protein [Myxococcales bacterium]
MRCSRRIQPCAAALFALLFGCSSGSTPQPPAPASVDPKAAYTNVDVPVTIRGAHFDPVASERVGHGGGVEVDSSFHAFLGAVELLDVQWQAPDCLTAVVPQGLDGGLYDLRVVGPTGEGTLPNAFAASTKPPASLSVLLSAPTQLEIGTQAEVDLILTNGGGVPVAAPAIQLTGHAGVSVVSVPGAPSQIAPGTTVHLVGLVTGEASGPAILVFQAAGTDAFDGNALSDTSVAHVQVMRPPSLSAVTVPPPDLASVGQSLDLVVTVTNEGDVDALGVSLAPVTMSGGGGATIGSLPLAQDIPAGASATFHVAAHATSAGAVFFSGSLAGSDALTGAPVTAQVAWPVVFVQDAPQLAARWFTVPSVVVPGQTFTATLGVTNSGGALAKNVSPSPDPPAVMVVSGSGSLSATASQAVADVPAGTTAVFSWTFTATGTPPASMQLSAGASGTDANAGTVLAASAMTSSTVSLQAPSALSATLTAPAAVLRGDDFGVTLLVTDTGGIGVNALTPTLTLSGTGTAQLVSGPTPPSQNVAPGGSVSFGWTYQATVNGAVAFSATVSGTDAVSGAPRSASAGSTVAISDAVQLASNPLGTATTFAYVFGYGTDLYAGPSWDGTGAMRMQPDGSGPQTVAFTFPSDQQNGNANAYHATSYPSLGFTGCSKNTLQCGPDNENGRGLLGSAVIGGTPWMIASGARPGSVLAHAYFTTDTSAAPLFRYDWIRDAFFGQPRGTSSMLVFHDRVYLGFGSNASTRPSYLVIRKTPASPGSTPTTSTVQDLEIDEVSGFGSNALLNWNSALVQMVDSQAAFNDLLYLANNGGIIRSNNNDPQPALLNLLGSDWSTSTPNATAYGAKLSITTTKMSDLEPADKAFPQFAVLAGNLYA